MMELTTYSGDTHAQHFTYSFLGEMTSVTNASNIRTIYTPYGTVTADGKVDQPLQWSSEMYDSGLALVYYKTADGCKAGWTCVDRHAPEGRGAERRLRVNYRYYNPVDGRWIRRDPAEGDYNLFVYVQNSTIKASDYLGLMSVGICNNLVSNILNNPGSYSSHIRQLIDELKKKGCGVPYIYCTECCEKPDKDGMVKGGGFSPDEVIDSIKLCSNNSKNATVILEALAHELIHTLQYCEFDHENDDWNDCDVIICQEIQAYRESGECQRTNPGNVAACVRKGTYSSSKRACLKQGLTEDVLKAKIASMYKRCYNSYGNPF